MSEVEIQRNIGNMCKLSSLISESTLRYREEGPVQSALDI